MANPYGIEQVDVPGILNAYDTARERRVQMMLQQNQLEQQNQQLERETRLHAAYAKLRIPGADGGVSAAVSAYGGPTPPATSASPAAVAAPPMDPNSPTQALASETTPAPAISAAAPASDQRHPMASWMESNTPAIQDAMRADPEAGMRMIQNFSSLDAAAQQRVKERLELADQLNEHAIRHLATVHDQASWDAARTNYAAELQHYGAPVPDLPAVYDPKVVEGLRMSTLSTKEQIDQMKPVVLGADSKLVNPTDGTVVADNPKDDLQHFEVHNADGSTTPYAFNPKTGETHQLTEGGAIASGSGAAPTGVGTSPKMAAVASTLSSAGLPAPVVAGMIGNFYIEGGYAGAQGDGGSASGIAQLRGERRDNFQKMYGKDPSVASPQEQAQFIAWEMQNPQKAGMTVAQRDQILAAKTPAQAAALIDQFYERSNGKARQDRMAAATAFASGGGAPSGSGTGKPITGAPLPHDPGDDDTAKFIGGQVALGQPMPPLGMGKQAAEMRRSILAEATKQWKAMGISPGEANVIAAQNKSGLAELGRIATIKANVQTAENTANSNAGQVLSLLGSAGTTGSPIFNSWQQAGRRATGDSKVSAFDVAVKTLATEYARVMSGGGNSPLSDAARHEADALIHTSMTPDQFRATIGQMKIDMANRSAGIEQERQATLTQIRTGGRGAAPAAPAPSNGAPSVGEVRRGYRYKGGPPGSPASWQKM